MRSDRAALLLDMLLVLVSVGAHQAGAEEFVFFLITLAVCLVVWRRERAGRPLMLNDTIGTVICLIAFAALMWRGVSAVGAGGYRMADVGVAPVGDFLIVFEWVTLCRRRKEHDYFWMYLVTLVLMGTAGLEMPGLLYGAFFIVYAFAGICALAAGHAAREALAASPPDSGVSSPEPAIAASASAQISGRAPEMAAGQLRIGRRFYQGALTAMLPLLILVAMAFIILPRTAATGTIAPAILHMGQQPTSGFSSTVRLGAVGEIQSNSATVMHVTVRDAKTGEALQPSSLLLRGLPLDAYVLDNDAWSWQTLPRRGDRPSSSWQTTSEAVYFESLYSSSFPGFYEAPYREISCDIALEPLDTQILFAPFAPEKLTSPRRMGVHFLTSTFVVESGLQYRRNVLNYTVTSRLFDAAPPPGAPRRTLSDAVLRPYLALPTRLSPRIRALAQQIAPPSLQTDYEKAQRILSYLSSDRFTYTTEMNPTPDVEPVEDFLFNLKRGHCEYFASSMVVMLREVNVPARVVNGFKVSEWNPIAQQYIVRQQHAHSWVEAYLRPYGWRTLDPSAGSREASMPKPMFVRRAWNNFYDWINLLWVTYILDFDSDKQAAPYGWLQKLGSLAQRLTADNEVGVNLQPGHNEGPEESGPFSTLLLVIRWLGAALAAAGLIWVIARSVTRMKQHRRPSKELQYYLRMERLLRRRGFHRLEAQTPWEFSTALTEHRWPAAAQVAAITDRFCRARYGAVPLTVADEYEIERALQAIRGMKGRNRQ